MNELPNSASNFFAGATETGSGESLWQYMQNMSPEMVAQLSRPASPEVLQAMERNIVGLLGGLHSEHFDVSVTTSRDNLGRLLASAMMSGYFLRNAEQRMAFEQSLWATNVTASGEG